MNPHAHTRSLPPEGAACRGSEPACAGLDGTKNCCVSQQCGLQDHASFEAALQEARP
jgi:hypothetical protein